MAASTGAVNRDPGHETLADHARSNVSNSSGRHRQVVGDNVHQCLQIDPADELTLRVHGCRCDRPGMGIPPASGRTRAPLARATRSDELLLRVILIRTTISDMEALISRDLQSMPAAPVGGSFIPVPCCARDVVAAAPIEFLDW